MVKFVLHGGGTSKKSSFNDLFFEQFTSLIDKQEVKILMCYWATVKERWNEKFQRDVKAVKNNSNKEVEFTLLESPKELKEKMGKNDVLFVAGGDAINIEPYYSEIKDLKNILEGKIYIGSSMGAFMVCKNYVLSLDSQDTTTVHEGLGLLHLNCLCHWNVEHEKQRKISLLENKAPEFPILTLNECQTTNFITVS